MMMVRSRICTFSVPRVAGLHRSRSRYKKSQAARSTAKPAKSATEQSVSFTKREAHPYVQACLELRETRRPRPLHKVVSNHALSELHVPLSNALAYWSSHAFFTGILETPRAPLSVMNLSSLNVGLAEGESKALE